MTNNKKPFNVGRAELCEWINFDLGKGFVQCGGVVYKQSSGISFRTAPVPDLANDFAFMHELSFQKFWQKDICSIRETIFEPLHRFNFFEQYGSITGRFIDGMHTVAPGLPKRKGPTIEQIMGCMVESIQNTS